MREERDDHDTQADDDRRQRERVRDEAAEALAKIRASILEGKRPDDGTFLDWLFAINRETVAAWSEYHAALVAIPVTADISALYQAVRDAVAALAEISSSR